MLNIAVFWDIKTQFVPHRKHIKSALRSPAKQLLVTAYVLHGSLIHSTLMMEATRSFETAALTSAKRRNIPEDCIIHSHCRENLKFYKFFALFKIFCSK
jgi:hypothetical protein